MFWYTYTVVLNHFSILKHLLFPNYSDTDRGVPAESPKHAGDARAHHVDAEKLYERRPHSLADLTTTDHSFHWVL